MHDADSPTPSDADGHNDSSQRYAALLQSTQRTGDLLRASETALADATAFLGKAERLSETSTWILHLGAEWSMTCSPESCRVLGLEPNAPVTVELFFSHVHPDDAERVEAAMTVSLRERQPYEIEYRLLNTDGTTRWVHAWAEPEFDASGAPFRVLGVVQDVTDRHTAEATLLTSESRFRLLAENAHDLIFRLTLLPEPRFEYVSPAAFAITGYTTDEIYAQPALALNLVTHEHVDAMTHLHVTGELSAPIDIKIRRKDGTIGWVSQQLTLVYDDAGTLVAVEGIDRDITERKRAEDERAHASLHDPLTGLPNRLLLGEQLELSRECARVGGHTAFVVSLDLDGFTQINYTYGYETGDAALVAVAKLLAAVSTTEMSVGRVGSDEFMFVGQDIDGTEPAALVERVRDALRQPLYCNGIDLHLQAHIGVAVDDPNESTQGLLHDAGIAVARAKERRSDTGVEVFDSTMRTRANERLRLVDDLYVALEYREFELRYQPIVHLSDDRIIGAEALIRWRHPTRGMVQPAEFIPLAEDTGLIIPIGAWVLYEACAQLRTWSDADPALAQLGMSVNLSVKQLRSSDIVDTVAQALNRSRIAPSRLTVEMTESVFADDLSAIRGVLNELRKLGVRTAIDDFGTGYSSLAYLKHLPIDTLKIDKAFVDGLGTDPRDDAIIASTLTVAKALTLFTVAEGVETAEQLAALRAMGCRAAQGFYMSEPVTGEDFASVVVERRNATLATVRSPKPDSPHRSASMPAAVLEATRALFSLQSNAGARRIAEELVRALGGTVVPAGASDSDAIPADLTFGAGPPSLATAALGSAARDLLDEHLATFLLDARRALELIGRTERLAESAATDVLTALPNRRTIERVLGRLTDGDAVIIIDLDHFKEINDEFGHATGDDVLRAFGHVLRETAREHDFVGRYGGEEFVVVVDALVGPDAFLRRLHDDWVGRRTVPITFSAGIASFLGDADRTMRTADKALYRAKAAGRDQWQWATDRSADGQRLHRNPLRQPRA